MTQIVIDVALAAEAGRAEELARLMSETQRLSRSEPGCVAYRFTRDLDDPATFYCFEIWADEAAIRGHFAGAPFLEFKRRLPELGRVVQSDWRAGTLEPFALEPAPEPAA